MNLKQILVGKVLLVSVICCLPVLVLAQASVVILAGTDLTRWSRRDSISRA